jgi:hypothetical protein
MRGAIWSLIFGLELIVMVVAFVAASTFAATRWGHAPPRDIRIDGNAAAPPQLAFACELATEQLQMLFSQPGLIDDLRRLHAGISLALIDLSAERAAVVRQLNEAGIPVTAWLALPSEEGYYMNATNAPQATARFAAFEKWSSDYGLRWAGAGLDIEPSMQDFGAVLQGHPSHLVSVLVRRCFDVGGVDRARNAYAALIKRIRADGYRVETYQFPFLTDERRVHSRLLERLFGIVDIRGDREALMTYTSFNHAIDSALIWEYGPDAQILTVGSTAGDTQPGAGFGPLTWREFTRDLIVAAHFSRVVGVYSLEGCVRQGYLPLLRNMNWGQSVTIPEEADRKVIRLRARIQAVLWTGSHLPYFVAAIVILDGWLLWRRHRNRTPAST